MTPIIKKNAPEAGYFLKLKNLPFKGQIFLFSA